MFELRVEWEDSPGVTIPVLRETWARLEFRNDGQPLTRFWSERTRSLRDGVYVSVFPLARWIVDNWWVLLGEGLRNPAAIEQGARRNDLIHDSWLQRHNLLACREGMAYPDLTLFREDDGLAVAWFADPQETTADGRFMDSGSLRVAPDEVEASLESLVSSVIERVKDIRDEEVVDLIEDWDAIQTSRDEEQDFCERIAMLGIDPYDADLDAQLESWVRQINLAPAMVRDLLAAAKPLSIERDWATAKAYVDRLPPKSDGAGAPKLSLAMTAVPPYRAGYARAEALRAHLGMANHEPVRDLAGLAGQLFADFKQLWVNDNGPDVEAAVQVNGVAAIAARSRRATTDRFLLARALHHWLYVVTPSASQRLLTRSGDWQQAASRAFAAELLAPARALEALLADGADWERQEELADELNVSVQVISYQIENHGLG